MRTGLYTLHPHVTLAETVQGSVLTGSLSLMRKQRRQLTAGVATIPKVTHGTASTDVWYTRSCAAASLQLLHCSGWHQYAYLTAAMGIYRQPESCHGGCLDPLPVMF